MKILVDCIRNVAGTPSKRLVTVFVQVSNPQAAKNLMVAGFKLNRDVKTLKNVGISKTKNHAILLVVGSIQKIVSAQINALNTVRVTVATLILTANTTTSGCTAQALVLV